MSLSLSLGLSLASRMPYGVVALTPQHVSTAGGETVIVTVSGPDITDATVTVGGASRSPTAIDATHLSFVTAAHAAGSVDVVVTTTIDGALPAFPLVYQAPVVLSSLTPGVASAAGGTTITVTCTNAANVTACTVGVTSCATTLVDATHFTFAMPAKAEGVYNVVAQTLIGDSSALTIEAVTPSGETLTTEAGETLTTEAGETMITE